MRVYDGLQEILPGAVRFLRPELYLSVIDDRIRPMPWTWDEHVSYATLKRRNEFQGDSFALAQDIDSLQHSFDFVEQFPLESDEPMDIYDLVRDYFGVIHVR